METLSSTKTTVMQPGILKLVENANLVRRTFGTLGFCSAVRLYLTVLNFILGLIFWKLKSHLKYIAVVIHFDYSLKFNLRFIIIL